MCSQDPDAYRRGSGILRAGAECDLRAQIRRIPVLFLPVSSRRQSKPGLA